MITKFFSFYTFCLFLLLQLTSSINSAFIGQNGSLIKSSNNSINRNNLTYLGFSVKTTENLTYLDLSSQNLDDKTFYKLNASSLTELDLSNNSFQYVPIDDIQDLNILDILRLNKNPIKSLRLKDKSIKNNSISQLYFQSCEIEVVELLFLRAFIKLKILDISNNQIKNLPAEIGNFLQKKQDFKTIFLDNNPLECNNEIFCVNNFLEKTGNHQNTKCLINQNNLHETNKLFLKKTGNILITELYSNKKTCDSELRGRIVRQGMDSLEIVCELFSIPNSQIIWNFMGQTFKSENNGTGNEPVVTYKVTRYPHINIYESKFLIKNLASIGENPYTVSCSGEPVNHFMKGYDKPIHSINFNLKPVKISSTTSPTSVSNRALFRTVTLITFFTLFSTLGICLWGFKIYIEHFNDAVI